MERKKVKKGARHLFLPFSRARQAAEVISHQCGVEIKIEEQFNLAGIPHLLRWG